VPVIDVLSYILGNNILIFTHGVQIYISHLGVISTPCCAALRIACNWAFPCNANLSPIPNEYLPVCIIKHLFLKTRL